MKRVVLQNSNGVRLLSSAAAKTYPPKGIAIQPAIKRSPTAVLEALSSTVGVDPTAPHFSLIDDPAMIPSSVNARKNYYLAKEMGKRAARQLAEEWPTLFAFDRDQPELPVFRPTKAADPLQVSPTEENLLKMIETREVKDAVLLYERMRSENVDVSDKIQLELFKLVCYYNGANPPFAEVEEWHGLRSFGEPGESHWVQGGVADLLFETIPQTPETISTLIAGLCKHRSDESLARAQALFKEHLPKNAILRDAFDALIAVSPWDSAKKLAKDMQSQKICPTLSTWNALLTSAAKGNKDVAQRRDAMQSVLGEMKAVGVTPSLTSYDVILRNAVAEFPSDEEISKESSPKVKNLKIAVTWLAEILAELEARPSLAVDGANDHLFFYAAIGIASRAGNLELADRLVNLYQSDKNQVKMPAFTTEQLFYNRYLLLYVDVTPSLEDVEKKYRALVPRLVGVSRQLTQSVAARMKDSPRLSLLIRLIEDGIAARQMVDMGLCRLFRERLMEISYQSLNVTERDQYAELIRRMVDIWIEFSNFHGLRSQVKLHPAMLSDSAALLNRIGDSDRAYKLLEMLLDVDATQGPEATVLASGHPRAAPVAELFEDALRNHDVNRAAICLEVMSHYTPRNKLEPLAMRIHSMCKLTETQARLIDGFVRLRPE